MSEERKARSKEEKKAEKEKNEQIIAEMGFCVIDGHKEKIGNFRWVFIYLSFFKLSIYPSFKSYSCISSLYMKTL